MAASSARAAASAGVARTSAASMRGNAGHWGCAAASGSGVSPGSRATQGRARRSRRAPRSSQSRSFGRRRATLAPGLSVSSSPFLSLPPLPLAHSQSPACGRRRASCHGSAGQGSASGDRGRAERERERERESEDERPRGRASKNGAQRRGETRAHDGGAGRCAAPGSACRGAPPLYFFWLAHAHAQNPRAGCGARVA